MEAHIGLSGLGNEEDSDDELETPLKLRKFRSPLHAWDIFRSNILWSIWVERCMLVISGSQFSLHSILFSSSRDTISAGMVLWAEIQRFAQRRRIEIQANLVEEFKVAWVGGFCLYSGSGLLWQFTPLDCMIPSGQFQRG